MKKLDEKLDEIMIDGLRLQESSNRYLMASLGAMILGAASMAVAGLVLWQTGKLGASFALAAAAMLFVVVSRILDGYALARHMRSRVNHFVATGDDPCMCGRCPPLPRQVHETRAQVAAKQGAGDG